jgi:CheY-like chemotaxis protein
MSFTGPILIVEDDADDQEMLRGAVKALDLPNKIKFVNNGADAYDYFKKMKSQPFLIFCDLKMPKMDGLELRSAVENHPPLKKRSIPFIFITGSADKNEVTNAYQLSVQGFFTKPNTLEGWNDLVAMIVNYWKHCLHPNRMRVS